MKSKQLLWLSSLMAVFFTTVIISACNKKFDEPDVFPDPNIPVTMTIKELKALLPTAGTVRAINDDKVIAGVVSADDRSGNFFKTISIQDATGGISVRLDGNNLFNNYPVGRRIYIKVKNLCVGEYGGMIQLGSINNTTTTITQTPIPQNLFDQYIIKGSLGNTVTPRVFTSISQLVTTLQDTIQNTLIQLNDFEFSASDTSKTFADPTLAASAVNFTIRNCSGNSIVLRTSSYSNFAAVKVPKGNGSVTAIYTFFNGTRQLLIRDTGDLKFTGARCGQGPTTLMNTADVRALYTGAPVSIPAGRRITGIVISDRANLNTVGQNLIVQQGNGLAGIIVRCDASHSLDLGDSIDVNISGSTLDVFSGALQVSTIPTGFITRISTGKTITPRVATAAQINTNINAWESTLVSLANVAISGGTGGTWAGSTNITDATGSVVAFTRSGTSGAIFQLTPYPTGNVTFVQGYLGRFNTTNQLSLRNLSDVGTSTGGGGGGSTGGISLGSTSPFLLNFNAIGTGLPSGVKVYTGGTATALGNAGTYTSALGSWSNFSAGFKNLASATGLTSTADQATQDAATNRALAVRQTSSAGYDPGASFIFEIDNTTGKTNVQLQFLLQSLDASVGRTTTWTVDYALGDNPTSFTAATATGTMTTSPTFGSNTINVNFGNALDNKSQKVTIRIVTLSGTTGGGNRPTTAIDDFRVSWN
jgi:hypothetical protein